MSRDVATKLKSDDVDRYFKKEEKEIKSLLKQKPQPERLHELRKELKTFYYNLKAGRLDDSVPYDEIDNIQELLGKWHDERVAEKYIEEREETPGINVRQKKALERTKTKLDKDLKTLVKQIRNKNTELAGNIHLYN